MKRTCSLLLCGLVALFIQGALLHCGLRPYLMPQLVTLLVVYLAFHEVSTVVTFVVFGLGLLLDFSSAILVGPWAGGLVAIYGVLAVLSQRLFVESSFVVSITAFFAAIAADVLYLGLAYQYQPDGSSYPVDAIGQAFVTALIAPVVFGVLSRILRRKIVNPVGRAAVATMA
jgi:rod shape-determining protein MreD